MPVCAQCGQENPDIAKFCLACGASLAAPEPRAEERKLVTVLFTDIVGSTAKAEQMDPALGAVGRVTRANPALLHLLVANGYVPVVACLAGDRQP